MIEEDNCKLLVQLIHDLSNGLFRFLSHRTRVLLRLAARSVLMQSYKVSI